MPTAKACRCTQEPVAMKIFVTGGAGFIGSNFIRHVLGLGKAITVVNYDKLTYAGNLGKPRFGRRRIQTIVLFSGDICDRCGSRSRDARMRSSRSFCRRISRRSKHLRACAGHRDEYDGDIHPAASGQEACGSSGSSTFQRTKCMETSHRRLSRMKIRDAQAEQPVFGFEGGFRFTGPLLRANLRISRP